MFAEGIKKIDWPSHRREEPLEGDWAEVNLRVHVIFKWSDKIVVDVDDFGEPLSYRSGYIMEVLPGQKFEYDDNKVMILGSAIEVEKK